MPSYAPFLQVSREALDLCFQDRKGWLEVAVGDVMPLAGNRMFEVMDDIRVAGFGDSDGFRKHMEVLRTEPGDALSHQAKQFVGGASALFILHFSVPLAMCVASPFKVLNMLHACATCMVCCRLSYMQCYSCLSFLAVPPL